MFILLTQGYFAEIDDEDYHLVKDHKWRADITKTGRVRAKTNIRIGKRRYKTVFMHRMIMGVTDPKIEVDHRDHNGINNRKYNLKLATHAENSYNQPLWKNSTTGYKGVSPVAKCKTFRAYIVKDAKQIHLGTFKTAKDAAIAYNTAVPIYHGVHGSLNIIN